MNQINIRQEIILKIVGHNYLFEQWIIKVFYLNNSLHNEYDSFYQNQYYISIYNLFNEGWAHVKRVILSVRDSKNIYIIQYYNKIDECINRLRLIFKDDEYYYLEYRRHGACHIFQDSYEMIQDNGKIKTQRNNMSLPELTQNLQAVIKRYNGDKGFDLYLNITFYPILVELYEILQKIRSEEQQALNSSM